MTTSLKHRIYRLITDDPSISIDELTSTLDADGDRVSRLTVSSIAGGFRETLKFLHSDGHLRDSRNSAKDQSPTSSRAVIPRNAISCASCGKAFVPTRKGAKTCSPRCRQ